MAFEVYIGYVEGHDAEIDAGESLVLEVRDLDTYERRIVRALVTRPGTALSDSDDLWILDWVEARQGDPWRIRVLEELEEENATGLRADITTEDLKAQAQASQTYAGGRGRGGAMPEMMGQEEARKFYENMQSRKLGVKKP